MGLFNQMKEPVFLKESTKAQEQLKTLKQLEPLLNEEGQALIRKDIKCLEYGVLGENNIIFELKNSHMPIYILQDIYLQDGDLSAQIDFMVFTKKMNFIIECKNLYGDIEINSNGDFIRTMTFGANRVKEGIYSPITQNERHLQLLRKIKRDRKSNIILKTIVDRLFDSMHKSIVVLANPKTVIHTKFAPKDVKDKVIRADQLVSYIKQIYNTSKEAEFSDKELLEAAQSHLALHQEADVEYTAKYEVYKRIQSLEMLIENNIKGTIEASIEETEVYKALKKYRLQKSKEDQIKPYFIYNNKEMEELILKNPTTLELLQEVSGFGPVKAAKYGEDILRILREFIR